MKSNILLQGEIGSGKTRSLITLLPEYITEDGQVKRGAGLAPFLITMEPNAVATLGRNLCGQESRAQPPIHHHYIAPAIVPWATVRQYALMANTTSLDMLLKQTDPGKSNYRQYLELMSVCANFTCDGCGDSYGDVGEWDETHAICLDSLTGLSTTAMQLMVGGKPIRSLPEYGAAMEFVEAFMRLFWGNTRCSAILLSHIDREISPLTGLSIITVHTIGQKLAPKLAKIPDEIILATHDKGRYTWTVEEEGYALKHRRLSPGTLPPDFSQIFAS
jgi:hypothetical protein